MAFAYLIRLTIKLDYKIKQDIIKVIIRKRKIICIKYLLLTEIVIYEV